MVLIRVISYYPTDIAGYQKLKGESTVAAGSVQCINTAAGMSMCDIYMCSMSMRDMCMCGMRMMPCVHVKVLSAHYSSES